MNAHGCVPLMIAASGKTVALEPVQADLAALLFEHPGSLPLAEADALVPVARNLPTAAGCLDLLLLSPSGDLTVVDCGGDIAAALVRLSGLFRMNVAVLSVAIALANCSQGASSAALARCTDPDFAAVVAHNLARRRAALVVVCRDDADVPAVAVSDADVTITVAAFAVFRTPAGETLLCPRGGLVVADVTSVLSYPNGRR